MIHGRTVLVAKNIFSSNGYRKVFYYPLFSGSDKGNERRLYVKYLAVAVNWQGEGLK